MSDRNYQQRPHQGPAHGSRNQREEPRPSIDTGLVRLLKNGDKNIDPELFNDVARKMARTLADSERKRNKSSQLRRFYDELTLWEMRTSQQPEKFEEYLPFIRMLNAKAAYAQGRELVDVNFVTLLNHTLSQVNDASSMSTCKLFWEAFMGFYKLERGD